MKKVLVLLTAIVLVFVLASCNNGGATPDSASNDSKIAETYTIEGVSVPLPIDFSVDESASPVAAYHKDYPSVGDNINFIFSASETINSYTKENINKTYEDYFDNFSGVEEYEKYQINGNDVVKFSYTIKIQDAAMSQTQVICAIEKGVIAVTYTNISGDYAEAFEESIKGIVIAN